MANHEEIEQSILVDFEQDSTLGDDDNVSETMSLRSSVMEHVYENGRRYHSFRQGAYWYVSSSPSLARRLCGCSPDWVPGVQTMKRLVR